MDENFVAIEERRKIQNLTINWNLCNLNPFGFNLTQIQDIRVPHKKRERITCMISKYVHLLCPGCDRRLSLLRSPFLIENCALSATKAPGSVHIRLNHCCQASSKGLVSAGLLSNVSGFCLQMNKNQSKAEEIVPTQEWILVALARICFSRFLPSFLCFTFYTSFALLRPTLD